MKSMIHLFRYFLLSALAAVLLPPAILAKGNSFQTSFKVESEYRNNIVRSLDSLILNDTRLNVELGSRYVLPLPNQVKTELTARMLGHFYSKYSQYNRNDYTLALNSGIDAPHGIRLNAGDEFSYRNYPDYAAWKYTRNIYDFNLVFPVLLRPTIGYQGWAKAYPGTNQLSAYQSRRWYLKLNKTVAKTGFTLRYETQHHEGNLYPNTAVNAFPNYLSGRRQEILLSIDQFIGENIIIEFHNRFEDDTSNGPEFENNGEQDNEEEIDALLSEDSDFNYRKYQASLALFYQLTPRISTLSYNVYQTKRFKNWLLTDKSGSRRDQSVYSNNTVNVKLTERYSIDFKYILEKNLSNVHYFKYRGHSLVLGIRYAY